MLMDSGLVMVTGQVGGGKSYYLAEIAREAQRAFRPVYSNYPINGAYRLTLDMLINGEFVPTAVLLIDEAGAVFNSAKWQSVPIEVFALFTTRRHLEITLYVGVQHAVRVAKSLRETADYVVWCKSAWRIIPGRSHLTGRRKWYPALMIQEWYMSDEHIGDETKLLWRRYRFNVPSVHSIYKSHDVDMAKGAREVITAEKW